MDLGDKDAENRSRAVAVDSGGRQQTAARIWFRRLEVGEQGDGFLSGAGSEEGGG